MSVSFIPSNEQVLFCSVKSTWIYVKQVFSIKAVIRSACDKKKNSFTVMKSNLNANLLISSTLLIDRLKLKRWNVFQNNYARPMSFKCYKMSRRLFFLRWRNSFWGNLWINVFFFLLFRLFQISGEKSVHDVLKLAGKLLARSKWPVGVFVRFMVEQWDLVNEWRC